MADPTQSQDAEQAPPVNSPTYVESSVGVLRKEQAEARETRVEQESKVLAQGSETEFWDVLKERMLRSVKAMRQAESTRMGSGPIDLQAVGLRSLIINEVADAFQGIITMVEHRKRRQAIEAAQPGEDLPDTVGLEVPVEEEAKAEDPGVQP